jgi:hypothetical protein
MSDNIEGDKNTISENLVKVFLYNKVNENGRDNTKYIKDEIQSLIDRLLNSKDSMFERRKHIGVGFLFGGNVYGEFKVIKLLFDVLKVICSGNIMPLLLWQVWQRNGYVMIL